MATCPECDAEVEVDETDIELGDEVSCPECGQTLVISNIDPFELDFALDDEDDDEDKKAGDEDEEDSDEDEDEDEGGGADWEEE